MANTLSILVRQQLPEFVRSDYDTFVAFVEAYYEWMDQSNNAVGFIKSIPTYLDTDTTLDDFSEYFLKQFLPLFPADRLSNPMLLLQHAKEFYRAKGTAKAFRLLFRLLYSQDVEIFFPKNSILRASDGQWARQQSLRLDPTIWTLQTGDGSTTQFRSLADSDLSGNVAVYFDGVLQSSGYSLSPNEPVLNFTSAPGANVEIKVEYDGRNIISLFNTGELVMRVQGMTSNATAITEIAEAIVEQTVSQLNIVVSNPRGTFDQSEEIFGTWTYDVDTGDSIDIHGRLISYLASIEVVDGGLNYNVGDPVIVTGGDPSVAATAVVEEVYEAVISNIRVLNGGAGYQAGQSTYITSTPNVGLTAFVGSVDTSGSVHPNSYPINQDVLNLWSSVIMSNTNYYFSPAISENSNTIFMDAFTDYLLGQSAPERLGPVSNITIVSSTTVFSTAPTIRIDAPVVTVTGNTANGNTQTANVSIGYFGILGRMNVHSGGSNYRVADEVSFVNPPGSGIGVGGAAEVTEVHVANSGIKAVRFMPSRLTGNVNVTISVSNTEVIGVGTAFTTELRANDRIEINAESSYVQTITNNNHLVVNTAFTRTSTMRKCGVYGRYFIGGINYSMNARPTVTVHPANSMATGANITVDAVISGGETFLPEAEFPPGQIVSIRVVTPGYGYTSLPTIDLTGYGNGRANAIAIMLSNLFTAPGRFLSTRGFLSSDQRLEGRDYYYEGYSYVIRSQTELSKYKSILKELIHPAGTRLWGEYIIESETDRATTTANVANTYQTTA